MAPDQISVLGASGFVGSAVVAELESRGLTVHAVPAPRLQLPSPADDRPTLADAIDRWRESDSARRSVELLAEQLAGSSGVINAAGIAVSSSDLTPDLVGANALLPAVLAKASQQVGCRAVHISSAAVQGGLPRLDETGQTAPTSPYSLTKAEGERVFTSVGYGVIYRATSVQGPSRAMTKSLLRLVDLPLLPLAVGARPIPLTVVENAASAIAAVAMAVEVPGFVTHPWEGVDTTNLIDVLGGRARRLPVSDALCRMTDRMLASLSASGRRSSVVALRNRVALLLRGTPTDADALDRMGWTPPVPTNEFGRLLRNDTP